MENLFLFFHLEYVFIQNKRCTSAYVIVVSPMEMGEGTLDFLLGATKGQELFFHR